MVIISTGNDAVHNVVGGGDIKNVANSKYMGRGNYLPKMEASVKFRIQ